MTPAHPAIPAPASSPYTHVLCSPWNASGPQTLPSLDAQLVKLASNSLQTWASPAASPCPVPSQARYPPWVTCTPSRPRAACPLLSITPNLQGDI